MNNVLIEDLAYVLKEAKANGEPKPIFFLGAGASKSGGIPLAQEIIADILSKYSEVPKIKRLSAEQEKCYSELMSYLEPYERDNLLKEYIKEAKINVTHIYIAQLIKKGFIDYVLTVNFDNLMLRALALFNEFPSTYDMAILKDLTTTTFKEKSVVFLHGQHHGLWLLNTEEELKKVKETLPRVFDSIKNKRPWVFIGYSGEDPVFEHIKKLGRFDNGLYWVTYKENDPSGKVMEFLKESNVNASVIKGYDSDSFMLKLNSELKLEEPEIVNKPFTSLLGMLDTIVDIDDEEHFKNVKQRLEISKDQVKGAVEQFEEGNITSKEIMDEQSVIDILKKNIINLLIKEEYPQGIIDEIIEQSRDINDDEINALLADLYCNWGTNFGDLAEMKEGQEAEDLYQKAFVKYAKAIELKSDDHEIFYNWGINLGNLAKMKEGSEAEDLYQKSFAKYEKAIELKPDNHEAFNNLGANLGNLAKMKEGQEAEALYQESIEKLEKAIEYGASSYNLSCIYALKGDKENSFKYLQISLENSEIDAVFVENDEDWKDYSADDDFIVLLNKYRKLACNK